jgi:DNA-binding HxlR family transcriptional regulator
MKKDTITDNQDNNLSNEVKVFCPIHATIDVLSGKWKLALLWQLRSEVKRFGELRRALPGITQAMLSNQLQELVADGMVAREEFAELPPRTEYRLTPLGLSLLPVIAGMEKWGIAYIRDYKKGVHGACLWSA